MNCKQFNTTPLEEVLQKLGHLPTKQNEKEAWFLNPFGTETQASFKLDKKLNLWYLFSEGIGGNNTDFMLKYSNTSLKEVLEWAQKQNFSSFQPQINFQLRNAIPNYQIQKVIELQNENLKKYLFERGLSSIVYPFIKEIHFTINDKNLYAIGFENLSKGWELRNTFYKGSLQKKDISIINFNRIDDNKKVVVFEGFMDALSFIEMQKIYKGDLLVMNSIALLDKTKTHLKNYSEINLFLDNDRAGINSKNTILKSFPNAKDYSNLYKNHKDLNEYLIEKIKKRNEIHFRKEPEKPLQKIPRFKRRR